MAWQKGSVAEGMRSNCLSQEVVLDATQRKGALSQKKTLVSTLRFCSSGQKSAHLGIKKRPGLVNRLCCRCLLLRYTPHIMEGDDLPPLWGARSDKAILNSSTHCCLNCNGKIHCALWCGENWGEYIKSDLCKITPNQLSAAGRVRAVVRYSDHELITICQVCINSHESHSSLSSVSNGRRQLPRPSSIPSLLVCGPV